MATAATNTKTKPIIVAEPSLLAQLRRDGYQLIPHQPRPLTGQIVAQFPDATTGGQRAVTDYELAARKHFKITAPETATALGRTMRQTWAFEVEGVGFQFNEHYESRRWYGLLYLSHCRVCGVECRNNVTQPPSARCRDCWRTTQTGPRCPETDLACSTAYMKHHCDCETCRGWNAAKQRARRTRVPGEAGGDVPTSISIQIPVGEKPLPPVKTPTEMEVGTSGLDGHWSGGWTWLPASVRASLAAYEAWIVMWQDNNQDGEEVDDGRAGADRDAAALSVEKGPCVPV